MRNLLNNVKNLPLNIKNSVLTLLNIISYMFLIIIYAFLLLIRKLALRLKFLSKLENTVYRFITFLDKPKPNTIARTELINLALQNMVSKKNRSSVTIGGMAVGIAAIVFLVSIGYGLQSLVINRVARLEEMRQTDVSVLPGSNLLLNDEVLTSFRSIAGVELALPQIAVVGKVNYNNSSTDMAVYGVTQEYLEQSAISPVLGKSFKSNELETKIKAEKESTLISEQDNNDRDDRLITGDWVEVDGESDIQERLKVAKVIFPDSMKDRDAVVNRSFLKVLSISEEEAIGKKFNVSYISTSKSLLEDQNRIESTSVEYTVIGVTPDDITPLFYVPFIHLKVLGISNYSQVKVVVEQEDKLTDVRSYIESQGFVTSSVVDTVEQINSLFATTRMILALLGTVALFVAGLGMFNTLTVSLLERTREVGLLKAMGMKSYEIRDLFLAESMIMGSLGGFLGLSLGLIIGKILEIALSIYAVMNGIGTLSIVNIPISFALFIILLSFLVGVFTGIYPAKRATKISALNALRYE
jgi:putative ABC transport system permease protein